MQTFSIIIPTYNRPAALKACLESLLALEYPRELFEVIVVNDGGVELTAVISPLQPQLTLRLFNLPHGGPAKARNLGAQQARHQIIAFTDDDCRPAPDWLNRLADGLAQLNCEAVGGRAVTPVSHKVAEQAWQHITDFLYDFMQDQQGNALLLLSNNVAYRRQVFEQIGGFNESFPIAAAEDMEISYRLLKHGFRQQFLSTATVAHHHHLTIWGYIKQQFRYGRGNYYFTLLRQQHKDDPLMALYFRHDYYAALRRSFEQNKLALAPRVMIRLGQHAYRFGLLYQTLISYG